MRTATPGGPRSAAPLLTLRFSPQARIAPPFFSIESALAPLVPLLARKCTSTPSPNFLLLQFFYNRRQVIIVWYRRSLLRVRCVGDGVR